VAPCGVTQGHCPAGPGGTSWLSWRHHPLQISMVMRRKPCNSPANGESEHVGDSGVGMKESEKQN